MVGALVTALIASAITLDADAREVAALPGEPASISAAGLTRSETPLVTLENASAFGDGAVLRLVIIGGLDGDARSARAALNAVRWFKTRAPESLRRRWVLSALPLADPDAHAASQPLRFPPVKGFFDDPEQPESRYVWRWVVFQAPDLVIDMRAGTAPDSSELKSALATDSSSGIGSVPVVTVTVQGEDGAAALRKATADASRLQRSPLHAAIVSRAAREPLAVARSLAGRYPETPTISYIAAVAWINTLRLAGTASDDPLRAKVRQQIRPWLSGEKPLFGNQVALTAIAGTMIFAELARAAHDDTAARQDDDAAGSLALQGALLATARKPDGLSEHGQGWTDDMFMTSAVLSRTAALPGRGADLETATRLLIEYAARLQRTDGIFVHAANAPFAWGRGNGFAALGLMEALTALPPDAGSRVALLEIYRRQMAGAKALQAPDGMWRQVLDEPGSYREESATAMLLSAMARGIRLGWVDAGYVETVQRAWRALSAHVDGDGSLVDVCTGTGAGPTKRYYLDRPAISAGDDRGGAMALVAAMEMDELMRSNLRRPASRRYEGNSSTGPTVR
jgi:hypothetical protein